MFAVCAFAAALAVRLAVDAHLPPGFPYLTFFPAVIITAFVFGTRAGSLCAILSGFAAWYFFIAPHRSLALTSPVALALLFYGFIVSVDILLIDRARRAQMRLEAEKTVVASLLDQQKTMFAELQHRVANNMQFIGSLLAMQQRKVEREPAAAAAALESAIARLSTMARVHRRLYDPDLVARPVGQYLQDLCSDVLESTGTTDIACQVDVPPFGFELTKLTTPSVLIVEIVTNALKHAFSPGERGTITIRLDDIGAGRLALAVADSGRGIPQDFDPATSRSLGFRIVQSLASQLGGTVSYASEAGTTVTVRFPA